MYQVIVLEKVRIFAIWDMPTLTIQSMKTQVFTDAMTVGLKIYIYNGYLYFLHSGQSYSNLAQFNNFTVEYIYLSSVFDRYTLDFNAPGSCVSSLLQDVSPIPSLSTSASRALLDFSAVFATETVYPVGKLSNQDAGFYMELINYSAGFGYSTSSLLGCPFLNIDWPDDPKDFFIKLPQVELVTQVIKQAQICTGERLLFSWKVDHFDIQPSAIFSTDAPEGSQININATALGIGIYTISLSFSQGSEQTTIYPLYTQSNTLIYNYADATYDDSVLVLCGMTSSQNVPVAGKSFPFFAFYNKNLFQNYWLTMQSGLGDGESTFCQFDDENNNLFSIVQAKSTSSAVIYDMVYAYKIDPIGRLIQSKMLQTEGNQLLAPYGIYDNTAKSFYISGTIEQSSLKLTNQSGFIWKLDDNLNTIYFTVYSLYSLNVFPQAIASSIGGSAHQLVGKPASSGKLHIGVVHFLPNGSIFSNSFFISTIPDSYKTGFEQTEFDIVYRNQYVYSAFSYIIMESSEINEIYCSKHLVSTGLVEIQREFILPGDQGTAISINFIDPDGYFYIFVEGKQMGKTYIFKMTEMMILLEFYISYPSSPNSEAIALNTFRTSQSIYFMYSFGLQGLPQRYLMISKFKLEDMPNIQSTDYYCSPLYNQEFSGINNKVKASINGISDSQQSYWRSIPVLSKVYSISEMKNYIQNASMVRGYYFNSQTAITFVEQFTSCILQSPASPGVTKDFVGDRAIYISQYEFYLNLSPFQQCQGLTFTTDMIYSYQKDGLWVFEPLPSWIILVEIDISAPYLIVSSNLNSYMGNYTLIYNSTFLESGVKRQSSSKFILQVNPNQPPFLLETFNKNVTIFGMHSFYDAVYFDKDIEYNQAVIWIDFYDPWNFTILSTSSWVQVISNSSDLVEYQLVNPPNPSTNTVNYLRLFVGDEYNMLSPRNKAPKANSENLTSNTIPQLFVPKHFSKFFHHKNFIDTEGDEFTVDCNNILKPSTSPNKDWIQFTDYENGSYSIIGATPRNNQFAGIYMINCLLSDGFDDSPSTFQITVNLTAKPQIQLLYHPGNFSMLLPYGFNLSLENITNELREDYILTLYINNTQFGAVHSNWLLFDDKKFIFQFFPKENKYQGLHELQLKFDDEITTPTYLKFYVTIIPNYGLVVKNDLPNKVAIVNNKFMFHTNVNSLFSNPEKKNYTFYFREYGRLELPYFIINNYSNGSLSGFATEDSIGDYSLELVGVDDSSVETVISFTIRVQRKNQFDIHKIYSLLLQMFIMLGK
ncbi:cadg multi-domain protein [Stylonychia lemnae]|uniref:Cadg multi-domain protein n=1 Tax=Stylonychia lemnae TaxID=5949 RepID=A0A077ZQE7_STYLE|nr:cadg multi-domain protein [Stylonychia lemnae]|eukprot:CDW72133.1 cadg multi-domain protein [Stylonychia lemnae]